MVVEPEAFSIGEACIFLGIGRTMLYQLVNSGQLRARKLGKRTLFLRKDLMACLEEFPDQHGSDYRKSRKLVLRAVKARYGD
jgi:excisionase family DNA binding protein